MRLATADAEPAPLRTTTGRLVLALLAVLGRQRRVGGHRRPDHATREPPLAAKAAATGTAGASGPRLRRLNSRAAADQPPPLRRDPAGHHAAHGAAASSASSSSSPGSDGSSGDGRPSTVDGHPPSSSGSTRDLSAGRRGDRRQQRAVAERQPGDLTASFDMGDNAKLPLGGTYPCGQSRRHPDPDRCVRSVGMAGVDAVISSQRGRRWADPTPGAVSAPKADPLAVRRAATHLSATAPSGAAAAGDHRRGRGRVPHPPADHNVS